MHTTFYLGVLCLLCWYHQAILLRMWTIQYNLLYMARYVPISRYLPNYRFHTFYINLLTMAGNNYVSMIWQDFFDTITVLKKIVSRWPTSHFYWNFGVIYIIVRGFVPGGAGGPKIYLKFFLTLAERSNLSQPGGRAVYTHKTILPPPPHFQTFLRLWSDHLFFSCLVFYCFKMVAFNVVFPRRWLQELGPSS